MSKQNNALTVCTVSSIRVSIRGIAECAVDIAEIAIDRAYKVTIQVDTSESVLV